MFKQMMVAAAFVLTASVAQATTLNIPFTPGSGNSNENFVIDREGTIEIAIKAKERFVGELPRVGNRYSAFTGESGPGLALWNFDLSIDLGRSSFDFFDAFLTLDFNPAVGNTDLTEIQIDNPLTTGLSIIQASQNPGFGFLQSFPNAQPFDPFATGEYQLGLALFEQGTRSNPVASVTAFVDVTPIPVPASLPLLLAGLAGFGIIRRRRKTV